LGFAQLGQQADIWESTRHGKYYNSTYGVSALTSPVTAAKAGTNFRGSNSSSDALSAALATTYTGLCLSNPATAAGVAPINLIVHKISFTMVSAPSGFLAIGLITGWAAGGITAHTTPLNTNIVNGYVGAATASGSILMNAPQGNLDAACTLVGTPAWDRWLASNSVTAAPFSGLFDLDDDIIIPPGGYVAIGANAALGSGFFGTIWWEELAQ
jgi:hypothetical protein